MIVAVPIFVYLTALSQTLVKITALGRQQEIQHETQQDGSVGVDISGSDVDDVHTITMYMNKIVWWMVRT